MAHESVDPRASQKNVFAPSLPKGAGPVDTSRFTENLQRLIASRLSNDAPVDRLRARIKELQDALNITILEEKKLRLEKVRSTGIRDTLSAKVLDLRRSKLQKDTRAASLRTRLAALNSGKLDPHLSELGRLEKKHTTLLGDLDAFQETLMMHRRDRDRVYQRLVQAQSHLQDKLTESVLWKIINNESCRDAENERQGISGVTAELLGRLLVLEKEESYIGGAIRTEGSKNGNESGQQ